MLPAGIPFPAGKSPRRHSTGGGFCIAQRATHIRERLGILS